MQNIPNKKTGPTYERIKTAFDVSQTNLALEQARKSGKYFGPKQNLKPRGPIFRFPGRIDLNNPPKQHNFWYPTK